MYEEYEVKERLTDLEQLLGAFIVRTDKALFNTNKSIERLSQEMQDFKDEMKDFKDEMKDFKDEMHQDRKNSNKHWGELANKLGTLVEDIIAPSVGPVMKQCFKEEVDYIAVNVRKHNKALGLKGEFDVIATSASYVFLVETKSSPKKEHLDEFKKEIIPRFQKLFPEFGKLRLIPVFASLRFDADIIEKATQKGIYTLAFREWEYMDILNFDAVHSSK